MCRRHARAAISRLPPSPAQMPEGAESDELPPPPPHDEPPRRGADSVAPGSRRHARCVAPTMPTDAVSHACFSVGAVCFQ